MDGLQRMGLHNRDGPRDGFVADDVVARCSESLCVPVSSLFSEWYVIGGFIAKLKGVWRLGFGQETTNEVRTRTGQNACQKQKPS